jgi:hypothetical protein
MSKFIERLNEALHPAPLPMGFNRKPAESRRKARILLIAAPDKTYSDGVADMVNGADAVLLPVDSIPGAGDATVKAIPNVPCGESLTSGDAPKLEAISKNGCDFIIFRADKMGLDILQYEKMGKILGVDAQIEDGILRTVNTLPVDAIFIRHEGSEPSYFTWHDLMVFRRFTDFVSKPIMVAVTAPLTEKEILALWEAGVDAMVVATGPGAAGETLKKLRQEIDKVTFPAQRRVSKREAIVPHIIPEAPKEEKEDEEEEEDE